MKGKIQLGRFNLIYEPWISVIVNEKGESDLVSLNDVFSNAHKYIDLGGDTKTQDFAVLRVLLAILHTVYSRFDADGNPYENFDLDENFVPISDVNDDDEYEESLMLTWQELWYNGSFSEVIIQYLEKWQDHFYLFDDKYPFFQVTSETLIENKISKPSPISGKSINRLISESKNKVALFSPKFEQNNNKEILKSDEIIRWLITFQGYTGLSDKAIFGKDKYKVSKGWLYDLGGLYLGGNNLFETLMLNLVLVHPNKNIKMKHQKPSWEFAADDKINAISSTIPVDNLAELYTSWSRAIYINPETDIKKPFSFDVVKLPDLLHEDHFIEPMTLWRFNKSGSSKDRFSPKKHQLNQSIWRSFGLITLPTQNGLNHHQPGIIEWFGMISKIVGNYQISLIAISMKDDGNATSWVPVDEIYDELSISDFILTDIQENHWVPRINEAVETTKKTISFTFRNYLKDINEIRNSTNIGFVEDNIMDLYYLIDSPFREWILSIKVDDDKDEKILEWYTILFKLTNNIAKKLLENATARDFKGVVVGENQGEGLKNIATVHNKFMHFLRKDLKVVQNGK